MKRSEEAYKQYWEKNGGKKLTHDNMKAIMKELGEKKIKDLDFIEYFIFLEIIDQNARGRACEIHCEFFHGNSKYQHKQGG